MATTTYRELFAFLARLGFSELDKLPSGSVWNHSPTGIVLLFSHVASDETVRGADLLSVETRLQHHGLLAGSLQNALQAERAREV